MQFGLLNLLVYWGWFPRIRDPQFSKNLTPGRAMRMSTSKSVAVVLRSNHRPCLKLQVCAKKTMRVLMRLVSPTSWFFSSKVFPSSVSQSLGLQDMNFHDMSHSIHGTGIFTY